LPATQGGHCLLAILAKQAGLTAPRARALLAEMHKKRLILWPN